MTAADRSERLKKLSPEKRALLLKALREEAVRGECDRIPRRSQQSPCPLSFAQQRLWVLDRLAPGNPSYNMAAAVLLKGQLNLPALQQSLNEIVRRHEALRTTFGDAGGQPVQAIAPSLSVALPVVSLQELPEAQRLAEVRRLAAEEAQRPFDLSRGPLLRAALLQLGSAEWALLFVTHHIISDGWSLGVLVREVAALYGAFATGKPSPLPDLPVQYADYAVWQQERSQLPEAADALQAQLAYWRSQLGGELAVLPTDRQRPPVQTFRGAQHSFAVTSPQAKALKTLCRSEEATLFMTLLAAFQALLYCHTKLDDIAIGSPAANRNRVELEELIGFFVNTLVLRTGMSGNPSFRELLVRTRKVALEAFSHSDVPFEKLVEELQPVRDLRYNPLFQVWFTLQNAPMPPLELPGLTLSYLEFDSGTSRHDLSLSLWEIPEGLQGVFDYKTDLFEATTVARMARGFQAILTAGTDQPDIRLSELAAMLEEAERQHQLGQERELQSAGLQKLNMAKRKAIREL